MAKACIGRWMNGGGEKRSFVRFGKSVNRDEITKDFVSGEKRERAIL